MPCDPVIHDFAARCLPALAACADWNAYMEQLCLPQRFQVEIEGMDTAGLPCMIMIRGGAFMMGAHPGDPAARPDEFPRHRVSVPSFAMSETPVTFAQWLAAVKDGGCDGYVPERASWPGDDRPVIHVSHSDAKNYAEWLSGRTGMCYRLPTEAEWEYACCGQQSDSASRYPWGDDAGYCILPEYAWFNKNSQYRTWPVRQHLPGPWGVHDLLGNVREWVLDPYAPYTNTPAGDQAFFGANPHQAVRQVVRGGSWMDRPEQVRPSARLACPPELRNYCTGFRVVLELLPAA